MFEEKLRRQSPFVTFKIKYLTQDSLIEDN